MKISVFGMLPFSNLIKEGFIQRTSRGRTALDKTFSYLDVEKPDNNSQVKIF